MSIILHFILFLTLTTQSSAIYCVCKDGVGNQALQKALDYACGAGADCSPILQSGACYQPNTVKDHCSYAVNSYYQKKSQAQGTCDFSGAATVTQTSPSTTSTCVYPTSASGGGGNTTQTTTSTTTPVYNTGTSFNDSSDGVVLHRSNELFISTAMAFWFSGFTLTWV